jgi:hypothetical protein
VVNLSSHVKLAAYDAQFLPRYEVDFSFEAALARVNSAFEVRTPFTMTGWLTVFAQIADDEWAVESNLQLWGQGVARARYYQPCDPDPCPLQLSGIVYEFSSDPSPVPEPGTLLLLATGFGAIGRRAWKRRAQATGPM